MRIVQRDGPQTGELQDAADWKPNACGYYLAAIARGSLHRSEVLRKMLVGRSGWGQVAEVNYH